MEGQPPAKKKLRSQAQGFTLDTDASGQQASNVQGSTTGADGASQAKPEGERKKLSLSNTSTSFTAPPPQLHPALQQMQQGMPNMHPALGGAVYEMNPWMQMMMIPHGGPMSAPVMPIYGTIPQPMYVPNHQQQLPFSEEEFQENPEAVLKQMGLTKEDLMQQLEQEEEDQEFNEMIDDIELFNKDEFDPNFKSCTCCKGFIYNCKSKVCENLGVCQCKAHSEMEEDAKERFIPECKDCSCCNGFVYTCLGQRCKDLTACFCFAADD